MSYSDNVKKEMQRYADEYWMRVKNFSYSGFFRDIKPWLLKQGYTFSAGMGVWAVYDGDGDIVNKNDIPENVLSLLEMNIPLYDQELGSIMPSYPEEKEIKS